MLGCVVMTCYGKVVHVETFVSSKQQKVYSKLFVPVGYEVISVIAEGDLSHLAGVDEVPFRLGVKDKELKLYFNDKEE